MGKSLTERAEQIRQRAEKFNIHWLPARCMELASAEQADPDFGRTAAGALVQALDAAHDNPQIRTIDDALKVIERPRRGPLSELGLVSGRMYDD